MRNTIVKLQLVALLFCMHGMLFAQEEKPEKDVRETLKGLITQLKEEPIQKERVRSAIVTISDAGPENARIVVEELLKEVKQELQWRIFFRDEILVIAERSKTLKNVLTAECRSQILLESREKDKNYASNIVYIAGRMGQRGITQPLLEIIDSSSVQVRYVVEKVLGNLWQGEGDKIPVSRECKEVTTVLIGQLSTNIDEAEVYAIGQSLFQINPIPKAKKYFKRFNAWREVEWFELSPKELREHIDKFFQTPEGAKFLLPVEKRSPLHIYKTYRKAFNEQLRLEARAVLVKIKPLVVVDEITGQLREPAKLKPEERDDLSKLLTEITSVPFDIKTVPDENVPAKLDEWAKTFNDDLSKRKDERVRAYVIKKLRDAVRSSGSGEDREGKEVERWRWICINNLDALKDLPKNITDDVQSLLEPLLIRKEEMQKSLSLIETSKESGVVINEINKFRERLLQTKADRDIAYLFLDQMVRVVLERKPRRVITGMRGVMREVTGFPIDRIEDYSTKDRRPIIDRWLAKVRRQREKEKNV